MVNYDENLDLPVVNNGHTVELTLPHTMHMTDSDGTVYAAEQMHCHWGGNSEISGSEHTIDGIRSMMEIHIVHYNKKYGSYEEAKDKEDGLAVVAILVKVKEYDENTYYSTFISELKNIKYPGQTTTLKNINIRNLMPEDIGQYYTYPGSLTTPPCTENVKWFIFRDYVFISKVQAVTIENSVVDYNNKTIQNGYRHTQPLYNRTVEANFQYSSGECCRYPAHTKNQQESIPHGWKVKKIKKVHHH
ncbi:carbonic anhydrase 6 [Apodemus sylvaticus]|uniref:carbonic anhydrase 6 n=1 Tax=Apodemus sylvaticus TaxID=10129 RepID=UPI00224386C8|nr:carbonic anhydrase 6 [Apodemus sylvaticus]